MEDLIERARELLKWPTSFKLIKLANKFPSDDAWRYAVGKLEEAEYASEPYLISCLKTATKEETSPRVNNFGSQCPYSHGGLLCFGPQGKSAEECKGKEECFRLNYAVAVILDFNNKEGGVI